MKQTQKTLFSIGISLLLLFVSGGKSFAASESNIIPKPMKVNTTEGIFTFDKKTQIVYQDEKLAPTAKTVQEGIEKKFGAKILVAATSKSADNTVRFELVGGMADEEYILDIKPKTVVCRASTQTGIFYAMQSLMQVMGSENKKLTAQCMVVEDKPSYPWRGYMLDDSRHFFGKEAVKQYLDLMGSMKLNRFHWHLTDEPAWRIEIKRYPKLTEIGSTGTWDNVNAPSAFYTQQDVKEIVAYAAERHIMVIPEIDMPGHATSAARSYPEISGGGTGRWKDFTFHPAKETTYEFISNIFTEIAELFPAPYIHIGADEVHFGNQSWFTDPVIQKFIKDNYLIDEIGMEQYFVRRVCEIVNSKGKKMMGWDEILNTGITPKKAVVMWWRHDKPELLSLALEKGFDVIMTPRIPAYFDFVQNESHKIGRKWAKGEFNSLKTVYSFPENLEKHVGKRGKQVLGMQANAWTERIADKGRLDYMTFPRLLAMAEDGWTAKDNKDYAEFENRVKVFLKYLDQLGIKYYNPFDPASTPEPWGPDKADVLAEG